LEEVTCASERLQHDIQPLEIHPSIGCRRGNDLGIDRQSFVVFKSPA
jgi:hypothetical protein